MDSRPLKRIDILRHELKALRFILDNYHAGKIDPSAIPPREDFQSVQGQRLYEIILGASSREAAAEEAKSATSSSTTSISNRFCA